MIIYLFSCKIVDETIYVKYNGKDHYFQWTRSTLVQVMVPHLFGANPLPEPILVYCQLDPWNKFQWNLNRNSIISIQENAFDNFVGQNGDHFLQGEMIKVSLVGLGLYINKLKYVCHCVHITHMLTAEISIAHGLCRTISNTARHCLKCTSITLDGVGKHSKHSFGQSIYYHMDHQYAARSRRQI